MKIFFAFALLTLASVSYAGQKSLRIISLSPALTELIFALDFGENLVGVSQFSDFPSEAKNIKSVGPYTKPDIETIVTLKPDLVFVPMEGPEDIRKHLDQLNIHYSIVSMRKLHEIGLAAEKISEDMGQSQAGVTFKTKWDKQVGEQFSKRPAKAKSVFIEVQKEPLIAAGNDTFLDEIVSGCGGINIIKENGYPKISLELAATKNLDVVLLADYFANTKEKDVTVSWWKRQSRPPNKIVELDPNIAARPGPRLIDGIKMICKALR